MKRRLLALPLCAALTLAACGQSGSVATSPAGGRPSLPTGAEVRHPAAPTGAPVYLSLLSDSDESFYQTSVVAGSTVTVVDPVRWRGKETGKTVAVSALVPTGATGTRISDPAAQVLLLRWVLWQDRNSNGLRDAAEVLPLMSHDRAAYASTAVTLSFQTASVQTAAPGMKQTVTLAAGWSRAAHFVYLPNDSSTYLRSLSSDPVQRYELHEPTPISSQ